MVTGYLYYDDKWCLLQREIVAVLPKLIKLSPNVVKGVFDRIFTSCQGVYIQ